MYLLITGAAGKVGQHFIQRLLADTASDSPLRIRALCHNRGIDAHPRIDVIHGSISDRDLCRNAMKDITHVMHLATCKDVPEDVMDVTVKGLFWLLEEARQSPCFERFLLLGGDASIGHIHYPYDAAITEDCPHRPYPGCYALSKVLEEVMLQQFATQYDLDTCCLRAPWIMEKDDFKFSLTVGDQQFGGPLWTDLLSADEVQECHDMNLVPILCDIDGVPIKRSFVHLDDLASAMCIALEHPLARQELFHIAVNAPIDYAEVANQVTEQYGLGHKKVRSDCHSAWLDTSKAQRILGWKAEYDARRILSEAWEYNRAGSDARKIWYPG